jgi:pimeloyl-ACP methyl ester carboxylesterase
MSGKPTPYTTGVVVSQDGTLIGYRQLGTGPGLILVHGGMQGSQNLMKLASALADDFTLYLPDRRGRGLSGPHGTYSLTKEAEDVQALVRETDAGRLFGLSSGAIVGLRAALSEPSLHRLALYEPPLPIDPTHAYTAWLKPYEAAVAAGKFGTALVSIARGTGGTSPLTVLPRFIIGPLMNLALRAQAKDVKGDDVSIRDLVLTMGYDAQAVMQSADLADQARNLKARVLLLGGSKSPQYLRTAVRNLQVALPEAECVEFAGLGHLAAEDQPLTVAQALRPFFGET